MANDDFLMENTDEIGTVTLIMEDDSEVECEILAIFPAGEKDYIALLPLDDKEEDDVIIYRFIDHGEEEDPELQNIEDDEEYEVAADAFDELLDDLYFDEAEAEEADD